MYSRKKETTKETEKNKSIHGWKRRNNIDRLNSPPGVRDRFVFFYYYYFILFDFGLNDSEARAARPDVIEGPHPIEKKGDKYKTGVTYEEHTHGWCTEGTLNKLLSLSPPPGEETH